MQVPPRSRGTALARARSSYAARRVLVPAQKFIHTETSSGVVLLAAAAAALVWANSRWAPSYESFWGTEVAFHAGRLAIAHTLREWINHALMVLFFFVVGLEVKREFLHGELSDRRRASLPVACALGGMLVPALIYLVFNFGGATARGWGIPMATDIAFALGVLALAGERVPPALRIFLLALATVDDLGAILVIALFYSDHLSYSALAAALLLAAALAVMRRLGVQSLLYYAPVAVLFWFAVLQSGVHATIAGVVLGLLTPTRPRLAARDYSAAVDRLLATLKHEAAGDADAAQAALGGIEELTVATEAPADRLVRLLHPWSSYAVLPLFALANAGVALTTGTREAIASPPLLGAFLGLLLGKVAGITLFAWLAVRLRMAQLLSGVRWVHIAAVGVLGGIGFTVSLFIADLAFAEPATVAQAKLGVLAASLIAGIAGYLLLRAALAPPRAAD
jgi:NhaA family Na+:H+ antiporter